MSTAAFISHFSCHLPKDTVSSRQTENILQEQNPHLKVIPGTLESLTQIKERRISSKNTQASDLAIAAGKKTLEHADLSTKDIDCLIFASASQDIAEPATANIVQVGLQATCPAFDIKNACNSFLNGLEVASAFVEAGTYEKVLVVTGETPTRLSQYQFETKQDLKNALASFTLGDAGGAALVSTTISDTNILYHRFFTDGQHWQAAAVLGGGSRFPFDQSKLRFSSNHHQLKDGFISLDKKKVTSALSEVGLSYTDFKKIFVHQVASSLTKFTIEYLGLPSDKVHRTVERYGNLASASLPVAISEAIENGELQTGDLILVLGLASGISATIWILRC